MKIQEEQMAFAKEDQRMSDKRTIFHVEVGTKPVSTEAVNQRLLAFKKDLIDQGMGKDSFLLFPMYDGVKSVYVEYAPPSL